MDWRWDWFWSIVWNSFVYAVTLQWDKLRGQATAFKDWWQSLWDEIVKRVSDLKSWASGKISYLSGYAFGLYWQAISYINDKVKSARDALTAWINSIVTWMHGQVNWLRDLAYSLHNQAKSFAAGLVQGAKDILYPYIDYWIRWVQARFEWILAWRDLITNWLVKAKGCIDWLWHTAWGALQAFLADPIGFVLGWLLDPIRNLINWWRVYGPGLMTFVANELADLRTLWENGKRILKALVDDPEGFILDLLAPMFLDWLAGLIADSW